MSREIEAVESLRNAEAAVDGSLQELRHACRALSAESRTTLNSVAEDVFEQLDCALVTLRALRHRISAHLEK